MALSSQFSLSLELTKLLPFGPLANVAGSAFWKVMKELQHSGSSVVTEEELAQVLGRNRIDHLFASSFRTAVQHSMLNKITGIAELFIEAGAGPTVRRSLTEQAYFSTIVQLSLLSWTHELERLADGLARAFRNRAVDAPDPDTVPMPSYD